MTTVDTVGTYTMNTGSSTQVVFFAPPQQCPYCRPARDDAEWRRWALEAIDAMRAIALLFEGVRP